MQLNSNGIACITTFSGSMAGDFNFNENGHMSDDDILNRVMGYVRQHPNDEDTHEYAMDLLDELLG